MSQQIRFCTAVDGVRLAYATMGSSSLLIKTGGLTHLAHDRESPVWRHWWEGWHTTILLSDMTNEAVDSQIGT